MQRVQGGVPSELKVNSGQSPNLDAGDMLFFRDIVSVHKNMSPNKDSILLSNGCTSYYNSMTTGDLLDAESIKLNCTLDLYGGGGSLPHWWRAQTLD